MSADWTWIMDLTEQYPDLCGECYQPMPWTEQDHQLADLGVVNLCDDCWWRLCASPRARVRNWWHGLTEKVRSWT